MKVIYWVSLLGAVMLLANFILLTVCTLPQVPWLKSKDDFACGVNGAEVSAELTLSLWTRKHCALKWGGEGVCSSTCTVDKWNRIDCSTSRPEEEGEDGGEGEGEGGGRWSWPAAAVERKAFEAFKVLNHTNITDSQQAPYCYKFDKAARTAAGMVIAGMIMSLASFVLCVLGFLFLNKILPPDEPVVVQGESLAVVSSYSDLVGMEEEAESKRHSMEITRVSVADNEDDSDALSPPSSCLNGLYDIATASKVVIEWSPVTQLIFSIVAFCLYLSSVIAYPVIGDKHGWEEDHQADYEPFRGEGEQGAPHLHLAAGWYLLLTALIVQLAAIVCFSFFVHWFFHYSSKKFLNKSPSTPVLAIVQQQEMTQVD